MRMIRLALPLALLWCVFLAPASALEVAEAKPITPYRLRQEIDGLDVLDANGRSLHFLPYTGEGPTAENADIFTFVADMNFDGFPDVGLLHERGVYNNFYSCHLWIPGAERFARHEELSRLPNPRFVPGENKVVSCLHGCAVSHLLSEHIWENGNLATVSRVEQDYPEGGGVLARRYERGADGEMRLVAERNLAETDEPPGAHADGWANAGPNLFTTELPPKSWLVEGATFPDGSWRLRRRLGDPSVFLTAQRLRHRESGEDALRELIWGNWPHVDELPVERFDELAEKLSLPALRTEFAWGENEDARRIVAALVSGDEWDFFLVVEAPADFGPLWKNRDVPPAADAQAEALREDMERVLLSLAPGTAKDDRGLLAMPPYPPARIAPSCGDDSLRLKLVNLTRSTLRNLTLRWRATGGGGRFAWMRTEVEPGGEYVFTAADAAELDQVYLFFGETAFLFTDLAKMGKRQKITVDVVLDADDEPHLDLHENREWAEFDDDAAFRELISVDGKLIRFNR